MSVADELAATGARFSAWVDRVSRSVSEWAASERGQEILLGLDFLGLSSRIGDYYSHVGWYLPVHPQLHRYVLEHIEYQIPFDARRTASLIQPASAHWPWITESLLATPSIQSRRPVLADALFCIEEGRWHAAISTTLPLIEGVVSDHAGILNGMRVPRRLEHILDHGTIDSLEALSAVPALHVLEAEIFAKTDFSKVSVADTALNRHLILHGRTTGYGSEIGALRALMFVVALAELLDGALLLRSPSAPLDTENYLDTYGPLAPIRQAARAGAARRASARRHN